VTFPVPLCDFEAMKKGWAGALLSAKCCCFVQRLLLWKCHTIWASLSEENKDDDWQFGI